jgi:4-hydroxy-tetrahydrodipicolinate reductase
MTRVAVLGATGRMGRLVVAELEADADLTLVATVSRARPPRPGCFADAEVVIDFSLPDALLEALPFLEGRALVTGTTGLDAARAARVDAHAERGPLLAAPNFSVGVTLLLDLVARAAATFPDAEIEIVETHHRHKKDAPSGTALALGRAAAGDGQRPVGVHALRGGDVVGDHTVWLLADGERLALTHLASSRTTFARGAVRAARWIAGRPPGRYSLREVLGLV